EAITRGAGAGSSPGDQPRDSGQPAIGPPLELRERRGELPPHLGELVLDPYGRVRVDVALDDAARLQLLHALGEQPVGELRDGLPDLREAHRATLEQDG